VSLPGPAQEGLPSPPFVALRTRVLETAERLREEGHPAEAANLVALVETWWAEQSSWDAAVIERLRVHHDINNALVGISGNAQLLMRDPVAGQPGVRERLEVMLRESRRIQDAAAGLRGLKASFEGAKRESRAA
jgi:signal transduction histidine kinase